MKRNEIKKHLNTLYEIIDRSYVADRVHRDLSESKIPKKKSGQIEGLINIITTIPPLLPPAQAEIEFINFLCDLNNEILTMLVVVMYVGHNPYLTKNDDYDKILSNMYQDFIDRSKGYKIDILKGKLSCLPQLFNEGILRLSF